MDAQRRHVLLIEDDTGVRRTLARALYAFAEVTDVYSATTALALLDRNEAFDAVVSDFCLDALSGGEFYELLRTEHPRLLDRFILITGTDPAKIDDGFRRALGDRLLTKPVDLDVLRLRVLGMMGEESAAPSSEQLTSD